MSNNPSLATSEETIMHKGDFPIMRVSCCSECGRDYNDGFANVHEEWFAAKVEEDPDHYEPVSGFGAHNYEGIIYSEIPGCRGCL